MEDCLVCRNFIHLASSSCVSFEQFFNQRHHGFLNTSVIYYQSLVSFVSFLFVVIDLCSIWLLTYLLRTSNSRRYRIICFLPASSHRCHSTEYSYLFFIKQINNRIKSNFTCLFCRIQFSISFFLFIFSIDSNSCHHCICTSSLYKRFRLISKLHAYEDQAYVIAFFNVFSLSCWYQP